MRVLDAVLRPQEFLEFLFADSFQKVNLRDEAENCLVVVDQESSFLELCVDGHFFHSDKRAWVDMQCGQFPLLCGLVEVPLGFAATCTLSGRIDVLFGESHRFLQA